MNGIYKVDKPAYARRLARRLAERIARHRIRFASVIFASRYGVRLAHLPVINQRAFVWCMLPSHRLLCAARKVIDVDTVIDCATDTIARIDGDTPFIRYARSKGIVRRVASVAARIRRQRASAIRYVLRTERALDRMSIFTHSHATYWRNAQRLVTVLPFSAASAARSDAASEEWHASHSVLRKSGRVSSTWYQPDDRRRDYSRKQLVRGSGKSRKLVSVPVKPMLATSNQAFAEMRSAVLEHIERTASLAHDKLMSARLDAAIASPRQADSLEPLRYEQRWPSVRLIKRKA